MKNSQNLTKFHENQSKFDEKLSDSNNIKTQLYEHLKNYTSSFKNEGKDV